MQVELSDALTFQFARFVECWHGRLVHCTYYWALYSAYGPIEQIVQEHFNQDKLEVTTDSFVSYRLKNRLNVRFMSSLLQSYTIEGLLKNTQAAIPVIAE